MKEGRLHLLQQLKLPDRYERLSELLGPEVVRILVNPDASDSEALETAALSIKSRGEGLFVPIYGESGAGKTTLASSLTTFYPTLFAPSAQHKGAVTYDGLIETVQAARSLLAANDQRIIPINNDHREGAPPTKVELAEIKRFLRAPSPGARSIVFWPETDKAIAQQIATDFIQIAGEVSIDLPLVVGGPPQGIWPEIVRNTLELVNEVSDLTEIGVDPAAYDPMAFETLGKYMRKISIDFDRNVHRLLRSTQLPVSLVIAFVSESPDAGVLEKLCNSSRLGLLDASALLAATPNSAIGKWWSARRGLLVQTILRLNAHAFSLGPSASVTSLRQFGPEELRKELVSLSLTAPGPKLLHQTLRRSDLGKFLIGILTASTEDRGTPSNTSTAAFQLLAEKGFTYGADKTLNKAMADAWNSFFSTEEKPLENFTAEKWLGFCQLCPDNALYIADEDRNVVCIEYAWRKGDFLGSKNKSTAAGYILDKLKNYARELGWSVE